MKQLSIIIPVYNVEKYIRVCLESIFCQGMDENIFEVIIVNDGTKDNSMRIIEDLIHNHNNIIIVNQNNQGLSMARNNGVAKACGEYILFVDSDDLLTKDSLSIILNNAIKTKADLIVADFKKMNDKDIIESHKHYNKENPYTMEEKTGWELYLEDLNPRECYVWRNLIRRDLLSQEKISFTPGIVYEDIPFINELYLKAKKCVRIHKLLYIYRIGNISITNRIDLRKGRDFGTAIAKTWKLTQEKELSPVILQRLKDNIFICLSALLYGIAHEVPSLSDRKQIIKHLKESEPNLEFSNGLKQRFVNFMFKTTPYIYIEARVLYAKFIKRNVRY
jgi:glycosyltransferase involved in cell wall biosynthesis